MTKCEKCKNGTMQEAKYICRENDYSIVDLDNNLLKVLGSHDLDSADDEVGSFNNVYYCSCGKHWS